MRYHDAELLDSLVSLERGEVDRLIFSDPGIFEQEMECIFARAWHFLCHDSQIPRAGDFFETPVGRDSVLTVRQPDGTIKALLNTCAHRGNAVCRAEEGNTKAFMCTYHGWTYDLAGNLIGVPDFDLFYKGELDKSQHGLRQVAQLDIYHGFIFATFDGAAPGLEDYLGATGRLGIDLIAARDVEIVPGVQKFTIDCNWKLAVDNVFDWYHAQITHMSAYNVGVNPPSEESVVDAGGALDTLGNTLSIPKGPAPGVFDMTLLGEYGNVIGGPTVKGISGPGIDHSWRERPEVINLLGPLGIQLSGHPNIFPNSWISPIGFGGGQLCLRIPVSPDKTQIWWFSFVEKDIAPERRSMHIWLMNHSFGPAGFFEQEDGENWSQATAQSRGHHSRLIPQALKMNLGRGKVIKERGLARIEDTTTEHGQLWTYYSWAQWMKELSWDELRAATSPPDVV